MSTIPYMTFGTADGKGAGANDSIPESEIQAIKDKLKTATEVPADDGTLDRIEKAIAYAFEGEGEARSDKLSGDRLAHSARRAIERIIATELQKARAEERERCAVTAERYSKGYSLHPHDAPVDRAKSGIAAAICAGGTS